MADIAPVQPTAAELAEQLAQLQARRTTLRSDLATTVADHVTARAALVQGTPEAVDRVTMLHARSLALTEALEAVDGQLVELQSTLAATQRQEQCATTAAQLVPLAARAQEHQARFMAVQEEANAALQAFAAQTLEQVDVLIACRQEFVDVLRAVAPMDGGDPQYWSAEKRAALADGEAALAAARAQGADLSLLLVQRVGSPMTPFDRQPTPPPSPEPYGWALRMIVARLVQQRQQ